MNNKDEILNLVYKLDRQGERIIDILMEVHRIYQLDIQELPRLLDRKMKEKLTQQEAKLKTIRI